MCDARIYSIKFPVYGNYQTKRTSSSANRERLYINSFCYLTRSFRHRKMNQTFVRNFSLYKRIKPFSTVLKHQLQELDKNMCTEMYYAEQKSSKKIYSQNIVSSFICIEKNLSPAWSEANYYLYP